MSDGNLLETGELACGYGSCPVLENVTLTVRPGEVLAIIGPNGVGKSTLLRALGRLLRPLRGTVNYAGRSIWKMSSPEMARAVALAPQRTQEASWPLTVRESVLLGRAPHRGWWKPFSAEDQRVTDHAMDRLGIGPLAQRNMATLSGGEVRRVALARVLTQSPRVLLLDEPAAYLDLKYQAELLGMLRHLTREDGLAVVLTVHDLPLAALCADRVALLASGRLQQTGTPAEVLRPDVLGPIYGDALEVIMHPRANVPLVLPTFPITPVIGGNRIVLPK